MCYVLIYSVGCFKLFYLPFWSVARLLLDTNKNIFSQDMKQNSKQTETTGPMIPSMKHQNRFSDPGGSFHKWGHPKNGCFMRENPIIYKWMMIPRATPIFRAGNRQLQGHCHVLLLLLRLPLRGQSDCAFLRHRRGHVLYGLAMPKSLNRCGRHAS